MTVYLFRHGTTLANERHLYCGSTDLPLSENGRAALMNRPRMTVGDVRFLTSPTLRCRQTLALLFGDVSYEVCPDFREIDFGGFEMHGYEQLKDDPAYQAWLHADPERTPPPGGESGEQMKRRVLAAFQPVLASNRDTVIVTHGGVIAAIMESLFPKEEKNRYQWQPKPGSGYAVTGKTYCQIP